MTDYTRQTERELGLARIAQIREQFPSLRTPSKRVAPPVDGPPAPPPPPWPRPVVEHDPDTCPYCLSTRCYWCGDAGIPVEECSHTLSQRHGGPLASTSTFATAASVDPLNEDEREFEEDQLPPEGPWPTSEPEELA